MSRIGKKPVVIPAGVKVELKDRTVKVTGPLGSLELECHPLIAVRVDASANQVLVDNDQPDNREKKQLHGTMRALIANMVAGVSKGYTQKMEIYGTGYNVKEQAGNLVFAVGYCKPAERKIPNGVKVTIDVPATRGNEVPAKFTLAGIDKCVLGQFAAEIRKIRPPEPYKGKGIRYADEHIKKKAGKAFASGAA
jgi:large subunit ribosomal protein L6